MIEQAVRFPNDPLIHVASSYYHNETRCGLGGLQAPPLTKTNEAPTCPLCKRAQAA